MDDFRAAAAAAPPSCALRSALFRSLLPDLLRASLAYLARAGCTLAGPVCVFYFLAWVSSPAPWWHGALLALALGALSLAQYLFEHAHGVFIARAGIAARAGASGLVYTALLGRRACVGNFSAAGPGAIHNLHAIDAAALEAAPAALLTLLLQPLEVCAIVGLLAHFVGLSALGGLAVVCLNVSLVLAAGVRAQALDGARCAAADERVRRLAEFLGGMRAVKLLGWDENLALETPILPKGRRPGRTRATGFKFQKK